MVRGATMGGGLMFDRTFCYIFLMYSLKWKHLNTRGEYQQIIGVSSALQVPSLGNGAVNPKGKSFHNSADQGWYLHLSYCPKLAQFTENSHV